LGAEDGSYEYRIAERRLMAGQTGDRHADERVRQRIHLRHLLI
jgi:hypothetical protein